MKKKTPEKEFFLPLALANNPQQSSSFTNSKQAHTEGNKGREK